MIGVTIVLFLLGLLLSLVGTLWTGVLGFMENLFWGLACWLIPLAGLAFICTRWNSKAVRASFLVQMAGWISIFAAIFLGGANTVSFLKENLKVALAADSSIEVSSAAAKADRPPAAPARATVPARAAVPDPPLGILPVPAPPEFEPQPIFDFHQAMAIGYAAFEQKDYHTALINFRRALKEWPENDYAIAAVRNTEAIITSANHKKYMNLGYEAFDRGDYQTALLNFQLALEQRPDSPYAAKAIAKTKVIANGKNL